MGALNSLLKDSSLVRSQALIGGSWVIGESSREVVNPASRKAIGVVPVLGQRETEAAIEAASRAFPVWRSRSAAERSAILRRWHDLIVANADDLAVILTSEQGKPLAEARGEIAYAASFISWFAEEAKRVYGELMPAPTQDKRLAVRPEPVGVCAAITPWNFPAAMITRKVAPALAAGCTVVVKPAEATPLTALALAHLAEAAGVPPGVLNVLTGKGSVIGKLLCDSPVVSKLSFTGSTEVGRTLMAQCAPTLKRLSLELGGNAPFIVFDDADVDAAVAGAIASKYRNSGQTCVCVNRFLVQSGIHDAFAGKLRDAVEALKVGDGLDSTVTQGPLIDAAAVTKVQQHVDDAKRLGAVVMAGGGPHPLGGTFYRPTILTGVTAEMKISREETFGPVAALFRFDTEAEAIALANATEYGLAAYFYTRDLARSVRMSEALECGMVGINTGLISNEVAPFGGVKQSGFGREGSRHGIDEYLAKKYVCTGGL